jgi:hypothetical protein
METDEGTVSVGMTFAEAQQAKTQLDGNQV